MAPIRTKLQQWLLWKLLAITVILFCTCAIGFAQQNKIMVSGTIRDVANKPLPFASVRLLETGYTVVADNNGQFRVPLPSHGLDSITLIFSYVNKQDTRKIIYRANFSKAQFVTLTDQSLALQEVEVQARRETAHSVFSIIFDHEAIMQSQAFSLADILNKLPGKLTTAPSLQTPQTLTLRTSAGGMNALSNSFGIAIYIDGVRISNDANMQSRGLTIWGVGNSAISANRDAGNSYDVTYNGFDLRDIPIERIERIEVIQGIADARYGEMTSGAILITTRAGRTPVGVSVNFNGGSAQLTASKGFLLSKRLGAINVSGGYTNSNKDPRNSVKNYNRVNSSLQWTVNLRKNIKNTISASYDRRLDDARQDPDDDSQRRTFQKGNTLSLSERFSWDVGNSFINRIAASISYSRGRQETYSQWLLNLPPSGVSDKDTTGVYEGYFIPGNYLAVEHIVGIPVSTNANLDIDSKYFFTGSMMHRLSFGTSLAASANKGPGIIIDPTKPRWTDVNHQTQRPVNFDKTLPTIANVGFYVQDNISGKIFNRKYTAALGLRTDIQNGFTTFQPRLSTTLNIDKNLSVSIAYGTMRSVDSLYPHTDPILRPLALNPEEKASLVAFLKTLSGAEYKMPRPVLPVN